MSVVSAHGRVVFDVVFVCVCVFAEQVKLSQPAAVFWGGCEGSCGEA